jgi:hypothetical protein
MSQVLKKIFCYFKCFVYSVINFHSAFRISMARDAERVGGGARSNVARNQWLLLKINGFTNLFK